MEHIISTEQEIVSESDVQFQSEITCSATGLSRLLLVAWLVLLLVILRTEESVLIEVLRWLELHIPYLIQFTENSLNVLQSRIQRYHGSE